LYFYEKYIAAVEDANSKELQLVTFLDLGLAYEQIYLAIECHQMHVEWAHQLENAEQIKLGNHNLIRTFKMHADALRKEEKYSEALQVLGKCISVGHKEYWRNILNTQRFLQSHRSFQEILENLLVNRRQKRRMQSLLCLTLANAIEVWATLYWLQSTLSHI
jgi:hypothetical protein